MFQFMGLVFFTIFDTCKYHKITKIAKTTKIAVITKIVKNVKIRN